MGGGHVTRPDFGLPKPNKKDPMAEFYLILQRALERTESFALPGAYVAFRPPGGVKLYAEDIRCYCTFSGQEKAGFREIFAPSRMRLLSHEQRLAPDGRIAACVLTEEHSHQTTALRLLAPFADPADALPPVGASSSVLTLQLTVQDLQLADARPEELGRQMVQSAARKEWLSHPAVDKWLLHALSASQKSCRRSGF